MMQDVYDVRCIMLFIDCPLQSQHHLAAKPLTLEAAVHRFLWPKDPLEKLRTGW